MLKKLLALALSLVATAAHAEWKEAETAHFRIVSPGSEKQIARFATKLESIDSLLRMATGAGDDLKTVKVRVYQVEDEQAVQQALGETGTGIAGFYTTNVLGPFAVVPRGNVDESATFNADMVLFHEYTHHFMLQYFPAVYPSWYVEGFAELVGSTGFLPDGTLGYGMPAHQRGQSLTEATWLPIQDLLLKTTDKLPDDFDFYGQSWVLTHYLTLNKTRSPQLRRYLQSLGEGRSPQEAAAAFGDLAELNRDVHLYLDKANFPYTPVRVKTEEPVIRKIRVLTPGEAALIPETIALSDIDPGAIRKDKDREQAVRHRDEVLQRIRRKAAAFPSDAFAQRLLADAEYSADHYAEANAAADRLLAVDPSSVPGLTRKGLSMLQLADRDEKPSAAAVSEARKLLVRANRLAPDEAQPLVGYYESFRLAGQVPPQIAIEGLLQAVATVPQDMRARQLLVDELVREQRYGDAIAALAPIAFSPHDSPRRAEALKQMAELKAKLAQHQTKS